MANGVVLSSLRIFLVDAIGRVLFWPVWWYSLGLKQLVLTLGLKLGEEAHRLGLGLWWRNLLVPMYGQSDWQGRAISFLVRLVVGMIRSIVWLAWVGVALGVVAVWLAVLPFAGYWLWLNLLHFFA